VAPELEPDAAADRPPDLGTTLVAEAMRKAGLVWLSYGRPAEVAGGRPAWHVWVDGAAYVVTGPGEQTLPGLAEATEVTVVVPSKDTRARIVAWVGRAAVIRPDSATWEPATAALASSRLNAEGGAAMIERWSRECTVVQIVPTGEIVETAEDPSQRSLAERPRETSATTLGRQPWMLGGVRRHRR
jgi:hypothetical protein